MKCGKLALVLWLGLIGQALPQSIKLTTVVSRPVDRKIDLPGEFLPFQSVSIHANVRGVVERVLVDRGSLVHRGQLLAQLSAPEMTARVAEAESKVQIAIADRAQAESQLAAAQSTLDRLSQAAKTEGAIAGNELVQAQKQVDAARAVVQSKEQTTRSSSAAVQAEKDLQAYLRITAPFDGIVTERIVHPGALVGTGTDPPLLVIQEVSRLRLVVALPEEDVSSISKSAKVQFRVPAYPQRVFTGIVARISHSIDQKTRTMAVELDVMNRDNSLSPGMYPVVHWPVRGRSDSLFVPASSVVTTTERTFVIRNHNGRAEWVNVTKGAAEGTLVEVRGDLKTGDQVVSRATDEIREGEPVAPPPGKRR